MHCAENIVSVGLRVGSVSTKRVGQGEVGGHPQGDMHMVAARLGCERDMFGTRWATSHPDCMERLRKHYSHLVEGWFLAWKAAWALSWCMTVESAD